MGYLPCEICGNDDVRTGVCSSPLGPFSHSICGICLPMDAHQKWALDFIFEEDNWRAMYGKDSFNYFEDGQYKNYGTGEVVPIKMKDGREFLTRSEFVECVGAGEE